MTESITVYSTCPPSSAHSPATYAATIAETARWSEEQGLHGMLIYTDNSLVDPWQAAAVALQNTERLVPLVAIQPVYMHPYTAAAQVASLAFLHGRRVDLNMLAGGFVGDLTALGDVTPHDDRYRRTTEYTEIVQALLRGGKPVTYSGKYYNVEKLTLAPALPPELAPAFTMAGSSPAGLAAAEHLSATAVCYPKPSTEYGGAPPTRATSVGLRCGVIARADRNEAWAVAHERFPEDRKGQLTHELAMKVSDSHWHKHLSELGAAESTYWLVPFENYKTFCPYLVGSYDEVADEIANYMRSGFSTFILDVPAEPRDLADANEVIRRAQELMPR